MDKETENISIGVINEKIINGKTNVRFRTEPSTSSSIIAEYSSGEVFLSLKRGINSNWHYVINSSGGAGYIYGDYLTQINDIEKCNISMYVKTSSGTGAKLRLGPGTGYEQIDLISDNTKVNVIDNITYINIDKTYQWYRVKLYNGKQGFIPAQYLR